MLLCPEANRFIYFFVKVQLAGKPVFSAKVLKIMSKLMERSFMEKKPIDNWNLSDLLLVVILITFTSLLWTGLLSYGVSQLPGIAGLQQFSEVASALGQYSLTIIILLALAHFKHNDERAVRLLGFGRQPWSMKLGLQGIMVGLGLVLFAYGAEFILMKIFAQSIPVQPIAEALRESRQSKFILVGLILVSAVIGPVVEEIFFRGFAYSVFKHRFPGPLAIWLSGAFFGLAHFDMYRWLPLSLVGAFLTWVYQRTGALEVCMIAHVVWNGTMAALVYFW